MRRSSEPGRLAVAVHHRPGSPFILLIAAVALLIPEQMADMLDAFSVDGGAGIAVTPSFHVSLCLLTISAWY
jgi:hypothetical protein